MFWIWKQPKALRHDWPFSDSPIYTITILGLYTLFVFKYGKILMKNREPFNVRAIMLFYNIVQICFNTFIFSMIFYHVLLYPSYDFSCMKTLPNEHPIKYTEEIVTYSYFINKILDLADTIFFVLRKSNKQITLLHVYHHIGMVIGSYCFIRFYGTGGHIAILGLLNSFVHIIMYTYYFLSACSNRVGETLWWKRYITLCQLIQFSIIFVHTGYIIIFSKDCDFPRIWLWVSLTQSIVMMGMFLNFYFKSYLQPKNPKVSAVSTKTE